MFVVDAPTNIKTEVHATSCHIQWDQQRYVREYQITYSETTRNSIKLVKVDGSEDNVIICILDLIIFSLSRLSYWSSSLVQNMK